MGVGVGVGGIIMYYIYYIYIIYIVIFDLYVNIYILIDQI